MRVRRLLIAVLCPLALSACVSCDVGLPAADTLVVMSYNLQALFDGSDDGSEYDGYSVADGEWSEALYEARLEALASAVLGAVPGGPDVLAVQEAENEGVLEDLAEALGGYSSVVMAPGDGACIACGVLSRLPVVSARAHRASPPDGASSSAPRYLLEAELDVGGASLVVFAAHWKSKLGGAAETEGERREAAALASALIGARLAAEPALAIVLAGDLNENPDEFARVGRAYQTALMDEAAALSLLESGEALAGALFDPSRSLILSRDSEAARYEAGAALPLVLYCPWEDGYSYRYDGEDERIDQLLLSPGLLSSSGGLAFEGFRTEPPEFLVDDDGTPVGWNTASGSGYSDHLPIWVTLSLDG